jgi:hypothetical protein
VAFNFLPCDRDQPYLLEGCIYSDHAADLGFVPSARNRQAPPAHDLTGSTSGQRRGSLSNT